MRRIEYPVSPKYVPTWKVEHALRELVANALDVDKSVSVTWDGLARIEDHAEGIKPEFWVIGEGNGGEIGQFHEGMKLAALVLAREARMVEVETVGYTVSASIEFSETYGARVLVLTFEPNSRTCGTLVSVECTEGELENARSLFRHFSPPPVLSGNILDRPGALYITGVYVQQINSMWGYDFYEKSMANRDRSVLNMTMVNFAVSQALQELDNVEMLKQLLKRGLVHDGTLETIVYFQPEKETHKAWRRAFSEAFGKNACLTSGDAADGFARQHGYQVVELTWSLMSALRAVGVPTSLDVKKKAANSRFLWPATPLTETEQRIFEKAKAIAKKLVPDTEVGQTFVVEAFPDIDAAACVCEGLWRKTNVYIRRSVLAVDPNLDPAEAEKRALAKATGVLVHERLHGKGFADGTIEFEYEMTMRLGALAVELMA